MAQFGMQMPASRKKASGITVYTAMAIVSCVCLAAACAVMFFFAGKVGPDGNAFGLQEPKNIKLAK
jgi:hypothetical protein